MGLLTHSPKETYAPWNKGKLIGQEAPLKLNGIWAIRIHLNLANRTRDLAIDSKLRGCDLVKLPVRNISHGDHIARRATMQQRKQQPVLFEITQQIRDTVSQWIK